MNLKLKLKCLAVAGFLTFVANPVASAYQEIPVTNGTTVTGKVTFSGTPPPPKQHELVKFPQRLNSVGRWIVMEKATGFNMWSG